jgi:transcriptional regulator with XRE-family HTH domain
MPARQPRKKPKRLPAKLLAIRKFRGASQSEMVKLLNFQTNGARISEFENGIREPNLFLILSYARAGRVTVENLIDDDLDLFD